MSTITYRNRSKGRVKKDGSRAKPSWEYRFSGPHIRGKRTVFSKGGFATKQEAIAAGTRAYNEYMNTGTVFKEVNKSYTDVLDSWMSNYVRIKCAPATQENYSMILKTHILPAFGNHQVGAIQHEKIQIFINRLFDEGYARNTLVNVLGVLSCSLRYAKRQRWIQFNPAEDIDLPTNRVCANQRQKVRVPVPRDIIKQIFERFPEESSAYLPLMLAYHCGLRRGEAFGVTWQDIDLEHGILFVNHQMQWSKLRVNYQYLPPKYGSVRRVVLDQVMLDVLRRTREQQLQRRTHYAEKYVHNYIDNDGFLNHSGEGKEMDFLLCREDGAFMHHNVIDHASKVIRKELGYENFDFHSLRHTHASELNENGVNLKEIQRRLGHKTMEVTISTYLHATDMMEAESMRIMNRMYGAAN